MNVRSGFIDSIGNTPLIKLRAASEATGCSIYGKAEFLNPGGSVKDRAALAIIEDAEKSGKLRPGGVIVEGTAGNTGIGIALVANARGYRSVIVMPETQSQEKKDMLRLCGAELIEVPAVPYSDPNNYVKYSGRLAEELNKVQTLLQACWLLFAPLRTMSPSCFARLHVLHCAWLTTAPQSCDTSCLQRPHFEVAF